MADHKDDVIDWSVRMLQKLKFDGDEQALAAYVDALVDNNRESEGGNLELLEQRTVRELSEFLGDADASSFVTSLMRHLQTRALAQTPVSTPSAAPVTAASTLPTMSRKFQAPKPAENAAPSRQDAPSSGTQRLNAEPSPSNSAGRSKGGAWLAKAPLKVSVRDSEWKNGPRGGKGHERDGRESRDFAPKESWPGTDRSGSREQRPRDRSGSRGSEGTMPGGPGIDLRSQLSRGNGGGGFGGGTSSGPSGMGGSNASAGDDLRHVLSRSRPTPAKRSHDGNAHENDFHDKARDGRRDDGGAARSGHFGRNDVRGRKDGAFEPPQKVSRHSGSDSGVQGHGNFGSGGPVSYNVNGGPHGGMSAPHGVPPPELFHQMMMSNGGALPPGFPPPPPGMFGPGAPMNPLARSTGFPGGGRSGGQLGIGRGGRGRGRGSQGGSRNSSRQLNTILVVRNVPPEKLTLGALNQFFETFGTVVNIQVRPAMNPNHAFVEFAQRSEAQAAMNSVDAILGNRHVRVYWAREQDYEADGISLAGVEVTEAGGHSRKQQGPHPKAFPTASSVPAEDPEVVLQRKRKEIAAARENQMKAKTERQAEMDASIAKQKELFAKLSEADCSAEMKKDILKEIKSLGKKAEEAGAWIKAKEKPAQTSLPSASAAPIAVGRPQARPRGAMTADFRPKVVTISGATAEGLSETNAARIFRDTLSAKKEGSSWVLDFSTRRAAESATHAHWLLTQHFGPEATISLSDVRAPKAAPPTAGPKDSFVTKETGATNDVSMNGAAVAVESSASAQVDAPSLVRETNAVDAAQQ